MVPTCLSQPQHRRGVGGITNPGLYPGVETIIGDGAGALAALADRRWDDTIRDVLSWDTARGGPASGSEGLTAAEELRLLALAARG